MVGGAGGRLLLDLHAMPLAQALQQARTQLCGVCHARRHFIARQHDVRVELFRQLIEHGHVMVARIEELAHFLVGLQSRRSACAGAFTIGAGDDGRRLLFNRPGPLVQIEQHLGHRRQLRRNHLRFGHGHRIGLGAIGKHRLQLTQPPCVLIIGEQLQVDAMRRLQPQQHGHRQRPLVSLDLVQVARRYLQRRSQRGLRHALLFPQCFKAHAHESFAHLRKPRKFAGPIARVMAV
jgi:hypothetical protein